ncbi:MAG: NAD-dependent epimerase/dehydratase family protein [Candidatus Eisenbacteria bacterium]
MSLDPSHPPAHPGPALEVLLLGGSGLLSGAAASAFVAAGHHVTVLTRGERPLPNGVLAITGDRRERSSLAAALKGRRFDFTADFLAFDAADVEMLFHEPYASLGRYAMISTGQVYLVTERAAPPWREAEADRPVIPEPEAGTRAHANWVYGVGKRRAEASLRRLRRSHGVRAVSLRLPVVQGEADHSRRLWAYLERMLDGGPVLLPEGGHEPVRFVYAGDVANALVALAQGEPAETSEYNLAQPDEPTLREFLERVAALAGVAPRFVDVSTAQLEAAGLEPSASPYSGPWCSRPDPARAVHEWGFRARRSDEYLPSVVRAHLQQPRGPSHPGYSQRAEELAQAARFMKD